MRLGADTARFTPQPYEHAPHPCNRPRPHSALQNLKPEYERLAGILKGMVNVAAVDADQHKSLGGRFGIQGFPTIKLFNIDKQKPEDYQGERNSAAMLECDALRFNEPTRSFLTHCCIS